MIVRMCSGKHFNRYNYRGPIETCFWSQKSTLNPAVDGSERDSGKVGDVSESAKDKDAGDSGFFTINGTSEEKWKNA